MTATSPIPSRAGTEGLELANDKLSVRSDTKPRTEHEQLEFQRNNPHLFTTMSQSVGAYGELVTFDQVTANLQETLKRLQQVHTKRFSGNHPDYCMNAPGFEPNPDICQAIELIESDMRKVQLSFVNNYKDQVERFRAIRERLASEHSTSQQTSPKATPVNLNQESE